LNALEKLFKELKLFLPGRRLYFIYTHDNRKDRFKCGLTANTEISYWSLQALERAFPRVTFLRLQGEKSHRIASITSKDIVLGHIGETFLRASAKTKKMIVFNPWSGHTDRSTNHLFNCMPLDQELNYWEKAASIILLTSEYNVREYVEKQSNFWFEKFTELKKRKSLRFVHQPIDLQVFKRIKWRYGSNDFLYIGNNAHMKCLSDSKKLVQDLGKRLHIYGCEGKKISHLDEAEVNQLPSIADFFIQPGMWEAQSVGILEAAVRGFIPVVSKDTGYPVEHPFLLRYGDHNYNLKILKELLALTAEERKKLADDIHQKLVNDPLHNDWNALTAILIEEVSKLK
jgi:hypothetical protein